MFGKKKNVISDTPWDEIIKRRFRELEEAEKLLKVKTEETIVYSGVVNLLPQGCANQVAAQEKFEEKKRLLLCLIGDFDDKRDIYNRVVAKEEERSTTKSWTKCNRTAEEIMANVYYNFMTGSGRHICW